MFFKWHLSVNIPNQAPNPGVILKWALYQPVPVKWRGWMYRGEGWMSDTTSTRQLGTLYSVPRNWMGDRSVNECN